MTGKINFATIQIERVEELLPYLCKTDHFLAEVMHARPIRTQTEALGGDCCDYWYVGDKSPALAPYKDLKQI